MYGYAAYIVRYKSVVCGQCVRNRDKERCVLWRIQAGSFGDEGGAQFYMKLPGLDQGAMLEYALPLVVCWLVA